MDYFLDICDIHIIYTPTTTIHNISFQQLLQARIELCAPIFTLINIMPIRQHAQRKQSWNFISQKKIKNEYFVLRNMPKIITFIKIKKEYWNTVDFFRGKELSVVGSGQAKNRFKQRCKNFVLVVDLLYPKSDDGNHMWVFLRKWLPQRSSNCKHYIGKTNDDC